MSAVTTGWVAALSLFVVSIASAQDDRLAGERFAHADVFDPRSKGDPESGFAGPWQLSRLRPPELTSTKGNAATASSEPGVLIFGTGDRNNPLRRELTRAYAEDEFYVGFRMKYEPSKLKTASDPEFFVLWLDRSEGSDSAVHSAGVPNIGIHTADRGPSRGKNVFMVRFGSQQVAWSHRELEPGKTYRVVARLAKQTPGVRNDFNQIQLWVDPEPSDAQQPVLSLNSQAGIHQIRWVGFSTGKKTEPEDRIRVDDLVVSRSWHDAFAFLDAVRTETSDLHTATSPPAITWNEPIDFREDIYPILKDRCFGCHAGEFPDSGFRLDVRSELFGFSTGKALVIPGESGHSLLVDVLSSKADSERMPPDEDSLTEIRIAKIKAWIDQGLSWDDELLPTPRVKSDHWAFASIERPRLPSGDGSPTPPHPIDAFISARQREQRVAPVGRANRRALVRRIYLDLLGLPPTREQSQAFLTDQSNDAYELLIDRVLASPHYGERMARYWLDLARWGESQGYQHDIPRPFAWRYRDYVIDAFNEDKAYSQFLREQIAGDELKPYSDEALIATGFLGAARISGNQLDKTLQRADALADIVDNTSSVILGLTMECARCHNHKFEPILQRDYYAWMAFFAKGQLGNFQLRDSPTIAATEIPNWFSKDSYQFYLREAAKLKIKPDQYPSHTWGFYSPETGDPAIERLPVVNRSPLPYSPRFLSENDTYILIRGDAHSPGLRVEPAWPVVLGETPSQLSPTPRQAFADWLSGSDNPLVARVWVNRIWQQHFGRGLVNTPSNFGTHGAVPTHPHLLDWLASELISSGWSTKHIHRLIVSSATYQQSGDFDAASGKQDPSNTYLWRWPQRRLEAEAIRDSLLVTTGELNGVVGGPSVSPTRDAKQLRRTIYLSQRRSSLPDVMTMFDAPDGIRSCARREVSTVALQPLYLLNSPFIVKRAERLAQIVIDEAGHDVSAQITAVFEHTLGRLPTPAEIQYVSGTLRPSEGDGPSPLAGRSNQNLIRFCHSMMNVNEFVYIP